MSHNMKLMWQDNMIDKQPLKKLFCQLSKFNNLLIKSKVFCV